MKREVQIGQYDNVKNVLTDDFWVDNAKVVIKYIKKTKKVAIAANREGFIYLAGLFASIAEENVPEDFEWFLDSKKHSLCGELENNSDDVVIFKYVSEG